jgi:hypothetical protein
MSVRDTSAQESARLQDDRAHLVVSLERAELEGQRSRSDRDTSSNPQLPSELVRRAKHDVMGVCGGATAGSLGTSR